MRNKVILMMIMGVALMALPATAQTFGAQKVDQPNAVFHSTSTMMGSGSAYSANPTLNADGTAAYNRAAVYTPSGPYQAKKEGTGTPTTNPGDVSAGDQDNTPTPLGEAVLPMMLMAGAYLIIRAARRKVRSRMSERCE